MAKKRKLLESHPQWQPKNNRNNDFSVEVTIPISKPQKNVRIFNNDGTITYTTKEDALAKGYEVIQTQDGGYTAQKPFDASSYSGQPVAEIPHQATIGPLTEDRRSWTQKLLDATDLADRAGDGTLSGNIASNLYAFDQGRSPINGLYNTFGLASLAAAEGFLKIPNIVHKVGIGLGIGLPLTLATMVAGTLAMNAADNLTLNKYVTLEFKQAFPNFKTDNDLINMAANIASANDLEQYKLTPLLLKVLGALDPDYYFDGSKGDFARTDKWYDYVPATLVVGAGDAIRYGAKKVGLKFNLKPWIKRIKGIPIPRGRFLTYAAAGLLDTYRFINLADRNESLLDLNTSNIYNLSRIARELYRQSVNGSGFDASILDTLLTPPALSTLPTDSSTQQTSNGVDTLYNSNYIRQAIRPLK